MTDPLRSPISIASESDHRGPADPLDSIPPSNPNRMEITFVSLPRAHGERFPNIPCSTVEECSREIQCSLRDPVLRVTAPL